MTGVGGAVFSLKPMHFLTSGIMTETIKVTVATRRLSRAMILSKLQLLFSILL